MQKGWNLPWKGQQKHQWKVGSWKLNSQKKTVTPENGRMSPERGPFSKEISSSNHQFPWEMLVFRAFFRLSTMSDQFQIWFAKALGWKAFIQSLFQGRWSAQKDSHEKMVSGRVLFHSFFGDITPLKTNMTLENPPFSFGNTPRKI